MKDMFIENIIVQHDGAPKIEINVPIHTYASFGFKITSKVGN